VTPPYEQPGANVAFWTLFGLFALGEYVMRFRSSRVKRGRSTGGAVDPPGEERALLAALGEDYRRYAATRRRLFPGIW
jgi:protein-S-isoprenylcysteine O-methyltransferase Ste14